MSNSPITLTAHPGTFIWREPHAFDMFYNVPKHVLRTGPLTDFDRARITVSAKAWHVRTDHGGLLLAIHSSSSRVTHSPIDENNSGGSETPRPTALRWLRVGPELLKQGLAVTVTGCDRWADQSLHPLAHLKGKEEVDLAGEEVTIEVRREATTVGATLWMHHLLMSPAGDVLERQPLRQCSWFFDGEARGLELEVAVYAARPARGEIAQGEPLELQFRRIVVE